MQEKNLPSDDFDQGLLLEIGRRIEFFRKARGIKLEDLAIAVGFSRPSISNVEKGRHKLDVVKLVRVARHLRVGINDLVPEDGSSIGNLRTADREQLSAIRGHVAALRSNESVEDSHPGRLGRAKALIASVPDAAFAEKEPKAKP